ncbi:MAG: response regulator [Pseudomonadota bacterium]|nr:response regulator [Pseudomonadota bacterium]
MLVDDDPSAIQVMSRMLAQFRDKRFATSGEVALRLARESTPDLILMDIEMPGMTGLDVFEQLKADPALARVPVTGRENADAGWRCARYGRAG